MIFRQLFDPASSTYLAEDHFARQGLARSTRVNFDMLHVTPPQSAPDFIKRSPLADNAGWIEIDAESMQGVACTWPVL